MKLNWTFPRCGARVFVQTQKNFWGGGGEGGGENTVIRKRNNLLELFYDLGFVSEINLCAANPCKNSGTCVNFRTYYTCICFAEFEGANCQTSILLILLTPHPLICFFS